MQFESRQCSVDGKNEHLSFCRRAFGDYFGVHPVRDDRYEGCFWSSQSDGQFGFVPDDITGGFTSGHGPVVLKPPENIVPPGHQARPPSHVVTTPEPPASHISQAPSLPGYATYQSIEGPAAPAYTRQAHYSTDVPPHRFSQSLGIY